MLLVFAVIHPTSQASSDSVAQSLLFISSHILAIVFVKLLFKLAIASDTSRLIHCTSLILSFAMIYFDNVLFKSLTNVSAFVWSQLAMIKERTSQFSNSVLDIASNTHLALSISYQSFLSWAISFDLASSQRL